MSAAVQLDLFDWGSRRANNLRAVVERDNISRLESVRVLYRQPDTLALWGIPYEMRPSQSPGDLMRARDAWARDGGPRVDLSDWIWLGQPGWWGSISREDQAAIAAFVAKHRDAVPNGPNEWVRLADFAANALTLAQKEALYALARDAGILGNRMLKSFSGADQADSEFYYGERRVYIAVAGGTPLDEAVATEDKRWRAYAAEQARKVAAAPKLRRGPSSGWSTIAHRWVDPERFASESHVGHIRFMVKKALGDGVANAT